MDIAKVKGKKALFITSAGGHLQEALLYKKSLEMSSESIFITHENEQSRSLLKKSVHFFVRNVGSRDLKGAILASKDIIKIAKNLDFDIVVSTGAGISISALPLHFLTRKPYIYLESLTRIQSPSLAGRILEKFHTVLVFSSNFGGTRTRWDEVDSPITNLKLEKRWSQKKRLKVFVTLGTQEDFRFDRLVDLVLEVLRPGDQAVWQLGGTIRNDLPGVVHKQLSHKAFLHNVKNADVVITHCGVGSLLNIILEGIQPIAIPRTVRYHEHIDNHQLEAFAIFSRGNLVKNSENTINRQDLIHASRYRISN